MISKEKIKDIIYDTINEFENDMETFDFDYNKDLWDDKVDMIMDFVNGFACKLSLLIDRSDEDE